MKFLAISSIAVLFVAQQAAAYEFIAGCLQNHTVTAADGCTSIAATYQITEAEFYAMNPGLHHSVQHDCDNLDTGKNYCVCLKAPCPVANNAVVAPAASAAANATASASAAVSSIIASASSAVSSIVASASASSSSVPVSSSTSASASASASLAASSSSVSAKSSAVITSAFGVVTVGLVMTATTMLL